MPLSQLYGPGENLAYEDEAASSAFSLSTGILSRELARFPRRPAIRVGFKEVMRCVFAKRTRACITYCAALVRDRGEA
jgi:hypothetical protein